MPLTLTLLAKVLASLDAWEGFLSISEVYKSAIQILLQNDVVKSSAQPDMALETTLHKFLSVFSFWNHLAGKTAQPWSSFAFLGVGVSTVPRANLSLLTSASQFQLLHLSFQEYLAADFLARLASWEQPGGRAIIETLSAWLRTCAGSPWWSQVLLMTFEILSNDQRYAGAKGDPSSPLRGTRDTSSLARSDHKCVPRARIKTHTARSSGTNAARPHSLPRDGL